ncbi:hypothetical protein C3941_11355 [Kaistia algarum]|uniref:helix-turn-helix domain-containing protein n=1 Tax=Kaistia algarum TaxID=2083279 RepID=UPI000CE8859B|nr:helix-turn-helix transcriptional regulator [Kaistia algarum]MCX5514943.1 helix-turn-helix transcriptional regulator [Kaistia algarum]PPE79690.1 hypothetical protein C3941_11355 [Kaistia algarum]
MLDRFETNTGMAGVVDMPVLGDEAGLGCAGGRIVALREARGLSVIDLATAAGMIPDHLRAIEAGLCPTISERQALAAVLAVEAEDIGL